MCDHEMARCVHSTEVQDEGRFLERYECPQCGATGGISGREEAPPSEWSEYGEVFA